MAAAHAVAEDSAAVAAALEVADRADLVARIIITIIIRYILEEDTGTAPEARSERVAS